MNRNVAIYLKDILESMENAEKFVENLTYDEFATDAKTFYAVVPWIDIIGEAAKNVPRPIRQQYPAIPWKEMAGMRDKVMHFYFGVKPERVWLVVKEDVPQIRPLVQKALQDLQGNSDGGKERSIR